MTDQSKAGKAHVYGTPLIALIVAITGYLSNKSESDAASKKAKQADEQAEVSEAHAKRFSEQRLRTAYEEIQDALENQAMRINDLEGWVVELEEFIEDELEAETPRTRREKDARDARLAEIRAAKRAREVKARPAPAMALPDYEDVGQELE
jgi:Fe-S-cluster formation regulator IscX/YfhJ